MTEAPAWLPTRYTPPLTPQFLSDGPRLVELMRRHYRTADVGLVNPYVWQRWLFAHVLERYPRDWPVPELRGRLRFRQVVISMGRQNGKSLIGSGFSLYGLLQHVRGPRVLGIATTVEKANIVYNRTRFAIDHDPELSRRLRTSGTRGIARRDGSGQYIVQPGKDEGVQGEPVSMAVGDELHLMRPIMWDSIVTGQRSMPEALVVGITTAGDESSILLRRLYEAGDAAIANPAGDERFGFFLWEGREGATLTNPADIMAANPSVAEGIIPVDRVQADERNKPDVDVQRYTFNRFVASISTWIDMAFWRDCQGDPIGDQLREDTARVVFAMARTESWQAATVTATINAGDVLHTEVIASLVRTRHADLVALGLWLAEQYPGCAIAMEAAGLSGVGKDLRDRGAEVWLLTQTEMAQASAAAWADITQHRVQHPGDELLTRQMPHARRKNTTAGGWRVVPGTQDADSVLATIIGLHVARVRPTPELQIG